ncbi:MAG: hypothetical protein Q8S24_10785 [Eubacteriales bacterium]|nr:hypothetical protein [Eubacteriales bacterium]
MALKTVSTIHKQRINTAANWAAVNPVLETGQIGIENDTRRFKVGDGSTAWNALPYAIDDFFYGQNTVTTLASLPVSKRLVIASVTTATTLSLASALQVGFDLHIKLYNTSGGSITQPLPTSAPFESKKGDGANISSISVPAGGSVEINIISATNKYIIKTDA